MKKVLIVACVFALVLGITALTLANSVRPGIKNTPHDVLNMTGDSSLEPCAMCHTPHSGTGDYPLWNRATPGVVYDMYASPSYDMNEGKQPGAPSSLCLACHNGIYSSLVNYPGPGSIDNANYDYEMNPGLWAMLGTDLTNDHPVSFTYVPSLDNDANNFPPIVQDPTTSRQWIPDIMGGTFDLARKRYPLYGTDGKQFECATCHAVHDTVEYTGKVFSGGKSVGQQVFFLRQDNSGSKMCADCHIGKYGYNVPINTFGVTSHGLGPL